MEEPKVVLLDPMKGQVNTATNNRFGNEDPKAIREFADSLLTEGQKQPIGITWIDKDKGTYFADFGNRRLVAAQFIVSKGLDKSFKLQGIEQTDLKGDAEAQFRANIVENLERKDMTLMDKAVAAHRAIAPKDKGGLGLTQKDAGEILRMSDTSVRIYARFMQLPKEVQLKAHRGEISYDTLYALSKEKSPEAVEAKVKAIEDAKKVATPSTPAADGKPAPEPKKLTAAEERAAMKKADPKVADEKRALRASEIKADLATLDGPGSENSIRNIARALILWMDGDIKWARMSRVLAENCADEVDLDEKLKPSYIREEEEKAKAEREKAKERERKEKEKAKVEAEKQKDKEKAAKDREEARKREQEAKAKAKAKAA